MLVALMLSAAAPPAAASPAEIAAAVAVEFPAHDLNGDGTLSRAEFAAWMVALRAEHDARPRANRLWATAAFTAADRDCSSGVTAAELTAFLTAASPVRLPEAAANQARTTRRGG